MKKIVLVILLILLVSTVGCIQYSQFNENQGMCKENSIKTWWITCPEKPVPTVSPANQTPTDVEK